MFYRTLGKTNILLSAIGFGGGVFNLNKDLSMTLERAKEAAKLAVYNGINFIDMGKEYDEEFVSKVIEDVRDKVHIITRSESKDSYEMKRDINDSIKKLRVTPLVYEIMVNSLEDFKTMINNGVTDSLREAKSNGKIKFIGIFSHKTEVLEEAIKTNEFDVIMTLYNAVHRKAEEIFPLKKKYKFGFIAASPFATGILVDPKYDKNINIPGADYMSAENALKFVLSSKYVDATVIGMKTPSHIQENIKFADKKIFLTEDDRRKIAETMENFLGKDFCRMCRYCEGCLGVSIADLLRFLTIGRTYGYLDFVKWQYASFKDKIFNKNFVECEKLCPYSLPISNLLEQLNNMVR